MKASIKKEWLTKLTNRKYLQARGTLKKDKHRYCCLGVLNTCVPADKRTAYRAGKAKVGMLDYKTLKAAGLHANTQDRLINLNDGARFSFKKIAAFIKERL